MKRFFILLAFALPCTMVWGQEPADALRFSYIVPSGTARQQAIGGAMGSLGGDISATFVNPAGLGFYKTGDLVLTPAYHFQKNKAAYLGDVKRSKTNKFDVGTTGLVFAGASNGKARSHAFALALNTTGSFKSDIFYGGENNRSSYAQKYIEELNNSGLRDSTITYLFPHGASLAYNTYWLDVAKNGSGEVTGFTTRSPIANGLIQQQSVVNRGGIYEPSLAGAANFNDKLMLGGSVSFPYLHYSKSSVYTEADATKNLSSAFDYAEVEDNLTTKGMGFGAKAGVIYKPQEAWRIGLALHSPTVYSLTDVYSTILTTDTTQSADVSLSDYSEDYNDGQSVFKYTHITPYKIVGSVSYVLREIEDVTKQKGFITADVEYVNYKASSYHPESSEEYETEQSDIDYLKALNGAIDKAYKGAFNVKAGGELKFNTVMVRLGAAYFGNPYKNISGEKGSRLNLSGGVGYRNKGRFIDLTYVHSMAKDVHFPYRLQNGFSPMANIRSNVGNVLLTFGVKL